MLDVPTTSRKQIGLAMAFTRAMNRLEKPFEEECYKWVNSLIPSQASARAIKISESLKNLKTIPLDEVEISHLVCGWYEATGVFVTTWNEKGLDRATNRDDESSTFAEFMKAWISYAKMEEELLTQRAYNNHVGPEAPSLEDQAAEAMLNLSRLILEEGDRRIGMDEGSLAAAQSFSPENSTVVLPIYMRARNLYEQVLKGEEKMRQMDIKGLPQTAVAFKKRWTEMEWGETYEGDLKDEDFLDFMRDLIAQTNLLIEALELRSKGEDLTAVDSKANTLQKIRDLGERRITLIEQALKGLKESRYGEPEKAKRWLPSLSADFEKTTREFREKLDRLGIGIDFAGVPERIAEAQRADRDLAREVDSMMYRFNEIIATGNLLLKILTRKL
jgi:hypothetical protein